MNFIMYLFAQVEFIAILIISVLIVLFFIFNKKKSEKKEIVKEDIKTEQLDKSEPDEPVENIEDVVDFIGDYDESEDKTAEMIKKEIMRNYEKNGYYDFSKSKDFRDVINSDVTKEVSSRIDSIQGDVKNYVDRVDEDGKIIFLFDSLNFITKKHKPVIMPDGSIRVQNLLTLEDEIIFALENKKPIFIYDEKNRELERIESKDVVHLIADTEKKVLSEKVIDLEEILKKHRNEIAILNKEINKLEDTIYDGIQREKVLIESFETIKILESQKEYTDKSKKENHVKQKEDEINNSGKSKNLTKNGSDINSTKNNISQSIKHSKEEIKKIEDLVVPNRKSARKDRSTRELISTKDNSNPRDTIEKKTPVEEPKIEKVTVPETPVKDVKKFTKRDLKSILKIFISEKYLLSEQVLTGEGVSIKKDLLFHTS